MIDTFKRWLLTEQPPTSETSMPNTFRLPMKKGFFIVQRRFVIGCSIVEGELIVYVSGITENFPITDPTERLAFLRFIGAAEPPSKGKQL